MAKKETAPARTTLEEVNESLTGAAQKIEKNQKLITYVVCGVLALVAAAACYIYLVYQPGQKKAEELVGKADLEYLRQDTVNALKDYQAVAGDIDRAAVNAAVILYEQGKYKEAAQYLEKYSADGTLVGPASQSLLGDCYVNMGKANYDKAIACFDKAIKLCKDNDAYAPVFMIKKATVLHATAKYEEEAAIYQEIKDKFPRYNAINVDKYIERANALAGK